ncbi:hypothetical protein V8C44DRAFT_320066 [Trichoderma aethiopicum]
MYSYVSVDGMLLWRFGIITWWWLFSAITALAPPSISISPNLQTPPVRNIVKSFSTRLLVCRCSFSTNKKTSQGSSASARPRGYFDPK